MRKQMPLSFHPLPPREHVAPPSRRPPVTRKEREECEEREEKSGPRSSLSVLGGRYALRRFLDRGGTASVYLAEDRKTEATIAVKILSEESARSVSLRAHFLEGYRAIVGLEHEHVVKVFGVEEPSGSEPYVVMEPLEGAPLSDLLVPGEPLDVRSALRLAAQAALGLAKLHEHGIVHCDLKPENLFILGAPQCPDRLKIIDFGMAAVRGVEIPNDPYMVRGTAQYMAPEQILGDPIDQRTDIYALGVTLFRMLTGHLPFDLKLSPTLLRHQLMSPAPPPTWLREDLEPGIERMVLRSLAKHPSNRYESARALLNDLELALAGRSDRIQEMRHATLPDAYKPQTSHGEAAASVLSAAF
jgi:serine/threonine-protein kinase